MQVPLNYNWKGSVVFTGWCVIVCCPGFESSLPVVASSCPPGSPLPSRLTLLPLGGFPRPQLLFLPLPTLTRYLVSSRGSSPLISTSPSTSGSTRGPSPPAMTSTSSRLPQRPSPCWWASLPARCSIWTSSRKTPASYSMKR